MNTLTEALFAGVALCALTGASAAAAGSAPFHLTALHGGRVVNKTKLHNRGVTHVTSTLSVFTYVGASSYRKTQILQGTFYIADYDDPCSITYQSMKSPKKAQYGKIGIVTETHTGVCGEGVKTKFVGNSYKLTDPNAQGKTDHFVSTMYSKFESHGTKWKATTTLDVNVIIE